MSYMSMQAIPGTTIQTYTLHQPLNKGENPGNDARYLVYLQGMDEESNLLIKPVNVENFEMLTGRNMIIEKKLLSYVDQKIDGIYLTIMDGILKDLESRKSFSVIVVHMKKKEQINVSKLRVIENTEEKFGALQRPFELYLDHADRGLAAAGIKLPIPPAASAIPTPALAPKPSAPAPKAPEQQNGDRSGNNSNGHRKQETCVLF